MHNLSVLLPRGQSFCKKTDLLTALFLQLETRSPKGRNGCLPPGLEASEGLRQPPLEPDRKGFGKCEETGCERHPNSTSVAITALVPQTSGATGIMSLRINPHLEEVMVAEQQPQVVPLWLCGLSPARLHW